MQRPTPPDTDCLNTDCLNTDGADVARTERIVFVTTKDYRGQDGGRVVVLPIARGQDIRLALARAGRHDFLAAAVTATLATAALTANVAPRVTIVLP